MAKDALGAWTTGAVVDWILTHLWMALVLPLIYGVWGTIRGTWGPDLFLGIMVALGVSICCLLALKSVTEIAKGKAAVEDIKTLVLEAERQRNSPQELHPTIDMLEASRVKDHERQTWLIHHWQKMVIEVHAKTQEAKGHRTHLGILEEHSVFPSIRAYIQNFTSLVAAKKQNSGQSTYSPELQVVLDVIAQKQKDWRVS